jgi:hypothetical protein
MTGAFSTIVLEAPGQLSLYPGQLLSSLIAGACVESKNMLAMYLKYLLLVKTAAGPRNKS